MTAAGRIAWCFNHRFNELSAADSDLPPTTARRAAMNDNCQRPTAKVLT